MRCKISYNADITLKIGYNARFTARIAYIADFYLSQVPRTKRYLLYKERANFKCKSAEQKILDRNRAEVFE